MPELPEVETVRRGLQKRLKDFYVDKVEVLSERSIASEGGSNKFISNIQGVVFGEWQRRGKYLIATLLTNNNQEASLVIHLRMTGYFQWLEKPKPPCAHTRVRFWDNYGTEIRFIDVRNFGQLWWIPPEKSPNDYITGLKKLGPEPFSKSFTPEYLENSLKGKKRPIKSSLLDQSLIAGIGNIYADEGLFEAGITPLKESGQLKKFELSKLCKSLIKVMKVSIGKGGTTFSDFRDLEGVNGNYGGEAWVYRKDKKPCKKCGTIIKKTKLSGRGTHWCPKCQK